MDPRIILRGLIREIEQLDEPLQNARERKKPKAKIADIRHGDFAAFEVPHEIRVLNDSGVRGDLHYAEALLEARVALDSGDDARILEAALLLPTFLKEGRRRCERYNRTSGTRASVAKRTAEARARNEPITRRYNELLALGVPHLEARRQVANAVFKEQSHWLSEKQAARLMPTPPKPPT